MIMRVKNPVIPEAVPQVPVPRFVTHVDTVEMFAEEEHVSVRIARFKLAHAPGLVLDVFGDVGARRLCQGMISVDAIDEAKGRGPARLIALCQVDTGLSVFQDRVADRFTLVVRPLEGDSEFQTIPVVGNRLAKIADPEYRGDVRYLGRPCLRHCSTPI